MTTYYVDGAVGNDGNAGTSEGAGNAWATIDNAMNNVAAGDKVWVKASASYAETATIDTAGTTALPIAFEGYTSTTGDNGKVTMDGTSLTNCLTESITGSYYIFKNFIFANATSRGVSITAGDAHTYVNCEFNSNGSDGILCDNSFTFVCCEFTSNSARGILGGSSISVLGCVFANNTNDGIDVDSSTLLYRNVVYGVQDFQQAFDTPSVFACIGNTLDGENATSSTGVYATSDTDPIIVDNIIYDFATGVDISNSPIYSGVLCAFNLMNSNTTDYDQSGELIGYQDVSSAPSFTDEAGDDYTLGGSSPAIDAGITPGGVT